MPQPRYAIYYVPPAGPLTEFGARWLGWDIVSGSDAAQFDLPGLSEVTKTPRRYGFHATLKPPFPLAAGQTQTTLDRAIRRLAASLAPVQCDGLDLAPMGRFLALAPIGDASGLASVAESCVRALDTFRAPPSDAALAARRKPGLSPRQEAHLLNWGYPYVMEDFRFHMTLTARLAKAALPHWIETAGRTVPRLPAPFVLNEVALCAERPDGRFELLQRYTLAG